MTKTPSESGPGNCLVSYRAIEEALSDARPPSVLLVTQESGRVARFVSRARRNGLRVEHVTHQELLRRAGADARDCALILHVEPRGAPTVRSVLDTLKSDQALILLLDHVTDPHNYGAILRSADQFRVDAVVTPTRRAARLTDVVMQSSAGTARRVPVVEVANLSSVVEPLKSAGFWIYAADLDGDPVHTVSLTGRVGLILGSEGAGVSRLARERSDGFVRIPGRGHADSFNVSVACGILLYEVRRQQGWFDL